jgi:hypothetical protein
VPADLGVGQSTLHKWIADYRLNDLAINPQTDSALDIQWLRKENCSEPYAAFGRMLANGHQATDWAALVAASQQDWPD